MQKTIKLNSGYDMPTLGLGTWKSEPNKVGQAVRYALLEAEYKHIDGAAIYKNEPEIGKIYKEVFNQLDRNEIFITSKLWNTNHDPKEVENACKQTLKDLNLEYLDLYLMHWGVAFPHDSIIPIGLNGKFKIAKIPIQETWHAMENLVKLGLVKSIGVANFTGMMLHDLLSYATIKPAVNQIEVHPFNSQSELVEYCRHHGIVVTAYSPLGRQGAAGVTGPSLFENAVILELAKKYDHTPAQILINWAIMRKTVVIPKSVTPARIKENMQVYDFELSSGDMKKVDTLNCNFRYVDPSGLWGVPCFK